jgi:hypothetical protein
MDSNSLRKPPIWFMSILYGIFIAMLAAFYADHYLAVTMNVFGFPITFDDLFRILIGLFYLSFALFKTRKWPAIRWLFPCIGIFWLVLAGAAIMEAGKTDPELLQARALSLATPLMQAALNGDINAMDSLLHAGAAVSEKNQTGFTALDYASRSIPDGNAEAVLFLLDHGADIEAAGEGGITPLMSSAAKGNSKLAAILLDRGADVNKVSPYGWTALAEAVLHRHEGAVNFLLRHGANPNAEIESGHHNLLKIAREKGNTKIVEFLEQAGAKEN